MPFIENVGREDIKTAIHSDAGENSMLIQISDVGASQPTPLKSFKEIYQFNFEDVEDDSPGAITDEQAEKIAHLLRRAVELRMNVIVHCHAGIFRSGAVVECGEFIGMTPSDRFRDPNRRVYKKVMRALGHDVIEPPSSAFAACFYNRAHDF